MAYAFSLGGDLELVSNLLLALSFARIHRRRASALAPAGVVCTNQLCWAMLPVHLAIAPTKGELHSRLLWPAGRPAVGSPGAISRWRWAMAAAVWGASPPAPGGLHHYFLPLFWLSPAALLEGWRLARAQDGQGALGQQELAATSQK